MKTIVYFVEYSDKTVIVIEAENKQKALEKAKRYEKKHGKVVEAM